MVIDSSIFYDLIKKKCLSYKDALINNKHAFEGCINLWHVLCHRIHAMQLSHWLFLISKCPNIQLL